MPDDARAVMQPAAGWRFYGWWGIVLATFVLIWATNGLTVGGIAAFDPYLIDYLGVSRDTLKLGDTIMLATTAVVTILSGWAADRYGVRPVMFVGLVSLAAAFYGFSGADDINDIYLTRFVMGVGLSCCGLAICVVIVSRWFEAKRGLAIGLMLAGTSLGSAVFPELFTGFIEQDGWRAAARYAALIPLLLLPLVLFAIKEWPARIGTRAYGQIDGAKAVDVETQGVAWTYAQILARREFWLIGVAAFATFYSILGVTSNLILHARDVGYSPADAAGLFVPLFIMGLIGKVLSGLLSDALGRRAVWILCLALMLAGALMMASLEPALLFWGVACFGFGWGGNYSLLQAIAADVFGARSLGRVMGALNVLDAGGGAIGPYATALLFEQFGQSYFVPFLVMAGLIGVAIVLAWIVGNARAKPVV